jgi:glycosyltransferase involved in cell wall biosynthesis
MESSQPTPERRRIVILSGLHLCHNPRVLKEADALSAAGYDVEVLGAELDAGLAERDRALMHERSWRFTPVVRLTDPTPAGRVRNWWTRGRRRLGNLCYRRLRIGNHWQLGYTAPELLRVGRNRRADLYIGHLEPGIWAASRLAREDFCIGVDFEDWYSEDLTEEARRGRPLKLLKQLEGGTLAAACHATCTSHAMSAELAAAYRCAPPPVLYNVFPLRERQLLDGRKIDRPDRSRVSIYWFSQTLGPGRGLEDLFAAAALLPCPIEIHLRASANAEVHQWLAQNAPRPEHAAIHVHSLVTNDELLSRMVEHDIGFAGEVPGCGNKDLTASNKIFHYLLGGLAVVASDTQGQREVLGAAAGAGLLYRSGDPAHLAAVLSPWLTSPATLQAAKHAAWQAATTGLCWDIESAKLVSSIEAALASKA